VIPGLLLIAALLFLVLRARRDAGPARDLVEIPILLTLLRRAISSLFRRR
jgi:hypothetical protein